MNDPNVYIAGPMNSVGGNFNFPLFDFVSEKLTAAGCTVFSPADHAREIIGPLETIQQLSKAEMAAIRKKLLKNELCWIIDNADFVVMLPGWERSSGAKAEREVALAVEIPVREAPGHILMMDDKEIHDLGLVALDHAKDMA
jgi:Domain of unknown function (DUF4406)